MHQQCLLSPFHFTSSIERELRRIIRGLQVPQNEPFFAGRKPVYTPMGSIFLIDTPKSAAWSLPCVYFRGNATFAAHGFAVHSCVAPITYKAMPCK